jgi:adenosylhomocysteine nucleosidase
VDPKVAVVAALPDELRELERCLADPEPGTATDNCVRGRVGERDVVLCRTGIGVEKARERVARLLETEPIDTVLAIGFCGGLRDQHLSGDLLVANDVVTTIAGDLGVFTSDADLLSRAPEEVDGPFVVRRGRIVTVDRILRTSAQKKDIVLATEADVVDMESIGVAQAARNAGVPVLFARAIVDDAEFDLPLDFSKLVDAEGRCRPIRMAGALMRRPWVVAGLLDLRTRARRASRSLTSFVLRFLETSSD